MDVICIFDTFLGRCTKFYLGLLKNPSYCKAASRSKLKDQKPPANDSNSPPVPSKIQAQAQNLNAQVISGKPSASGVPNKGPSSTGNGKGLSRVRIPLTKKSANPAKAVSKPVSSRPVIATSNDSSLKRAPEDSEEHWGETKQPVAHRTYESHIFTTVPFIRWAHHASDTPDYKFTNTCPWDNTMMILSFLYQRDSSFRSFLKNNDVIQKEMLVLVLNTIRDKKFNLARKIWLESMLNEKVLRAPASNNMHGSEFMKSVEPLLPLFRGYEELHTCPVHGSHPKEPRNPLDTVHCKLKDTIEAYNGSFITR